MFTKLIQIQITPVLRLKPLSKILTCRVSSDLCGVVGFQVVIGMRVSAFIRSKQTKMGRFSEDAIQEL